MKASTSSFCRSLVLASACLAVWPSSALATDDGLQMVALPSPECESSQADAALLRALELELGAPLAGPPTATSVFTGRIVVSASCDTRAQVMTLRIWSSRSQQAIRRAIALRDIPEGERPRLLALVIAEALGAELESELGVASDAPAAPSRAAEFDGPFVRLDPYPGGSEASFTRDDPYRRPPVLRLALGTQARYALDPNAVLLAFEAGSAVRVSRWLGWAAEASLASAYVSPAARDGIDVSWWSVSTGIDLALAEGAAVVIGPRVSLGSLQVSESGSPSSAEVTLGTQLGARARLAAPLGERGSFECVVSAQHMLGVLALTSYTGLDTPLHGWMLSAGLGVAISP